jgi:ABC-type Fe3+-hydroxamate transport system substrate-binding protein
LTDLTDAAGTVHRPVTRAPRIVSLVPSITELVCELGLAENLVGRTGFCVHPREKLRRIPKVGGTKTVDLARLRDLAPTHVIVNVDENLRETAAAIAAFVPNLVVTHPLAPLDNTGLYRLIGGIFRREQEAEHLSGEFLACYDALAAAHVAVPRRRVLYLIWKKPWMTVSRDTYISRTLALVGLDTVPSESAVRYPEISLEDAVRDADSVLLSSEPYRFREKDLAALRAMPALAGKKIALVDGEMTSWYGPRAIAGLRYLGGLRARLKL